MKNILLFAFSIATLFQSAYAEPEKGSTAEKDTTADWTFEPNPTLPNVLIIGDSISIGYTLQVRDLLKEKANIFRPMGKNQNRRENCVGTINGLEKLDGWLAVEKWDVIHFNWGLHDLKHIKKEGSKEKSNDPNSPQQAPLENYAKNLQVLTGKLQATGARLVFATTTPVVENTLNPLRFPKDVIAYNKAALEIMKDKSIAVNDLYAYCLPNLEEWQIPRNCHFRPLGSQKLAEKVAKAIEKELTFLK